MSAVAMETTVEKPEKVTGKPAGIWGGIKIPIIGITGEKFSGKTLFLASIDPSRTCMIDLEDSSESYNIEFAARISLYDEMLKKHNRAATAIECYLWFMDFIEKIQPGQYSVLAVDPYSDIQAGMVDWVKSNPAKFGHTANQYEKASGLLWSDVKQHCKMMLGIVSRKVETFAFATHMGSVWKGGSPTDQRKAKGLDTLFELASLYLELERKPNEKGKVEKKPSGKVLKSRLAISKVIDGELEHFPILPPRMPVATPAAIREYIKNPPDYKNLKKAELVEIEVLTEDQKILLKRETAEKELEVEQTRLSLMDGLKQRAEQQADLKRRQEAARDAMAKPETASVHRAEAEANHPETTIPKEESPASATTSDAAEEEQAAKPKSVWEVLEDQKSLLRITPDKWLEILGKRGAKQTSELSKEQAEEIRLKLWSKLTGKDLAGANLAAKTAANSTANASKN